MKEIGLYIHVPFCLAKCAYCDFVSYPYSPEAAERYLQALEGETRLWSERLGPELVLKTVYVGGGTPTCLPPEALARLMSIPRAGFTMLPDAEITVEANPGTLDEERLAVLAAAGVNRLSIGMQGTADRLLRVLGRAHTAGEARQAFKAARAAGFTNINLDLIYGIPGQNGKDWAETLAEAVALGPEHISAYSLEIHPETPLGQAAAAGAVAVCSEETVREMYLKAIDFLTASGYVHYEIANFALPGRGSRHNRLYWEGGEYLGLGPGAHSYLGGRRWANTASPGEYCAAVARGELPVAEAVYLTPADAMAEAMFLGLRLTAGVSAARFQARFGCSPEAVYGPAIARLAAQGLLIEEDGYIRLTREALPVANVVFAAFV
jgi:oxygen-independent coproporphyrinogen-3 oxidase